MIKVSLVNWSVKDPVEAISHAARVCYQSTVPEWGKTIDIKGRLWETGHHTTFQHWYLTFLIEGIAVGNVTFGLHLTSPFYNTSQRSGRFCAKMFSEPDFGVIERYISKYWPDFKALKEIMEYIKSSTKVYISNIEKATLKAKEFIKEERPQASDKYIEQNAPKIAQEQLRMFIPLIFPTALEFTVNLSALAALYKVAWSPPMKEVTQKMADLVLKRWPILGFMFEKREESYFTQIFPGGIGRPIEMKGISTKPKLKIVSSGNSAYLVNPESQHLHPLDLLHFHPYLMDNNVEEIKTDIEISAATMGQDQRHRTVRRSRPYFTGSFYLPPIPQALGLGKEALKIFEKWFSFSGNISIPHTLVNILAPYGAMVGYRKSASYNAAIHELSKRLCWCAQEEIYHLACALREQLKNHPITKVMSPNCLLSGKCGEGVRYCGRDLKKIKQNPFPERKV
jgi:thymidylate synthase ThyX